MLQTSGAARVRDKITFFFAEHVWENALNSADFDDLITNRAFNSVNTLQK